MIAIPVILQSFHSFYQTKVAVIGGGIAGVSGTWFISELDSTAQIVLFEKEAKQEEMHKHFP